LKGDWQALRYQEDSGESWFAAAGNWQAIPEPDDMKPPAGDYKVAVIIYGENDWVALRLDRKTGRSWRLAALKWVEMKVAEPPKPAAAPAAE
jgi:hypothetical protein